MRVLADFHHQALYHSLKMLFEDRLGWELYRPIGTEWRDEGYWNVYNHPNTAEQYLGLGQGSQVPKDVHGNPLQESDRKNLHYKEIDGVYYVRDAGYGCTYKAVRLQQFKDTHFDILLSSIPDHIHRFNNLILLYQPHAKHIFQIGNRWLAPPGVENVMSSTVPYDTSKHTVFYHQEFDLGIFKYEPPAFHNVINSYIHYMKKRGLLQNLQTHLPGWQVTSYGAGMGYALQGVRAVAEGMRDSSFTWQFKPGGDGFGHVIFSSYACGRPVLVYEKHYRTCKANNLFEDQVTCIDTSIRPIQDVALLLRHHSQPEEHTKMCQAAYDRFRQVVDFDAEFEQIKKFLEDLR